MRKIQIQIFLLFFISFQISFAQQPQKPNSVEIYNQIKKLNFLGSVLYVAAHPDDENTRMISYLANDMNARTGYLSLTRGDGGQNLIGPQLRELLGVIRTQELIEARKIDGGEQFFSRANDFGFSKNPDETLDIWDKNKVLADVVWTIRKFQPDIIINRFDHRSPGTTHGHHTSSAMLSVESFKLTNDPKVYPEQLKYVTPWQVKRQFFNPSWWFYGSQEKFDAANKSKFTKLETGVYYNGIGKSNQEIAALSRSRHQSQGFGSTGVRGEETEYLELINGETPKERDNLFDGIDTSWNRVKNGKPIGDLISSIISKYDFNKPSASIPDLVKAYAMIEALEDDHWKSIKSNAIKNIIASCSGLYLEAVANEQEATPGSTLKLYLEAINRCNIDMQLVSVKTLPDNKTISQNIALKNNNDQKINLQFQLPENIEYTQPYWLKEKATVGMYTVSNQEIIGIPDIIRETKVIFNVKINDVEIPFERTIVYKYNDGVKGEMYNFLDIVPEVTTSILERVLIFRDTKSKMIPVKVRAGKDNVKGNLQLELAKSWTVSPKEIPFDLDRKGNEQIFYFEVTPPVNPEEVMAKSIATVDGKRFDKDQTIIDFNHITKQMVLKPAESKCIRIDLKTSGDAIAYIMGAGDEVPESLAQMGYKVSILKPEEITPEKLESFSTVITGIRAYNTVNALANKQNILFNFVKGGKNMIVQYNTNGKLVTDKIAPYPLKLSNDRVTEENAKITFLAPNHPVLNTPNKISEKDFQGWTQEQGLYYPNEYDAAFTPIISSHDKGESAKDGALLVAPYGKGYYIYTGLSFFRELPEGVSGAYRLLSNIISLKQPIEAPKQDLKQ
ncbi:LmbE family N-acetylglucosaminyl deacetylase [Flavobacterium nitrogenifigens]|uniref:LmbE family N-acetylglucosaminyl deacetylase n=2 Tax=Flavobacterium TaxID=237 RepID=A0A7W7N8P3_9FLAO|nr:MULTISPECIES: PIG-L family deacetylase [Flavobacterium]MBB4804048.1 LmbE family N-acetylglucosaminyl deacetylase [Flavobacterium nitrogenifigens]MBB6388800.1 LmbE family N-acetylglucosaminyl deacetylase [Flavobacterium notoginsengisoli]